MNEIDQIEKFYTLWQKKALTKKEFETRKKDLLKQLSDKTGEKYQLIYVVYAAFFGIFGVHNFYIGRWKRGCMQVFLACLALLMVLQLSVGYLILAVITYFLLALWAWLDVLLIQTDGNHKFLKQAKLAQYAYGWLPLVIILWSFVKGMWS